MIPEYQCLVVLSSNSPTPFNQAPNNYLKYRNYTFHINNTKLKIVDFIIVYTFFLSIENICCSPSNVIFVSGEPPDIARWSKKFLNQFSTVVSCDPSLPHPNIIPKQILDYFENHYYSFDELKTTPPPTKKKLISVIASNKTMCDGHIKRLEFVRALQQHFKNDIDVFGRGINEISCKWDALAPYKYHIAIENTCLKNSWTEKIMDPLLAFCHPIYYGAPNINEFFDSRCMSTIDINNIDLSIKTIETIIKNNGYEKSKHYIKLERQKMFNEYSVFHEFSTVLDTIKTTEEDKKIINIYTESDLKPIRTKIIKIFTTIKNYKFPTTQTFI